jgi:hypothetical protein
MNRTSLIALSVAIAFGSASGAMAASKKSSTDAHQAYAAEGKSVSDPREAYVAQRKGSDQTWCDADPACNGWGQWAQGVRDGKIKY